MIGLVALAIVACAFVLIFMANARQLGGQGLASRFHRVRRDFPAALLFCVLTGGLLTALTLEAPLKMILGVPVTRFIGVCVLGIPLAVAFSLLHLRRRLGPELRFGFGVAIPLLVLFSTTTLPDLAFSGVTAQLYFASLLAVSCVAWLGFGSTRAFWQFNFFAFSQSIFAVVVSGLVCAAVLSLFGAVHYLLGFEISYRAYLIVFVWCGFLLLPLVLLGGLPTELDALEEEAEFPRQLSAILRYVAIPFLFAFLAVLYVYGAKIALSQSLPKGGVGWLVCSYGALGTLCWLLGWPLREAGSRFERFFARGFFWLFFPILGLLWVAVWERISEYGLTEPRLVLVILSLWITIVALAFSVGRRQNIKLIPASLCVLAFVTSVGPLSVRAFALRSQSARLDRLLQLQANLTGPEKVRSQQEVSRIFDYLIQHHGLGSIGGFFQGSKEASVEYTEKVTRLGESNDGTATLDTLLPLIGQKHDSYASRGEPLRPGYVNFTSREFVRYPRVTTIRGGLFISDFGLLGGAEGIVQIQALSGGLRWKTQDGKLVLTLEREGVVVSSAAFDVAAMLDRVSGLGSEAPAPTFEADWGEYTLTIYVLTLTGERVSEGPRITNVSLSMYIQPK